LASAVDIETITVGNAGNPADANGLGGIDYAFRIGKYEVTAGQYTEFLNAVAATDTYNLYATTMASSGFGCKIQRAGDPGTYTYSVATDFANRPVNVVSWGDAARFANWLHNGQPSGLQDLTTTEDGSYFLNGAMSNAEFTSIVRKPDATWVIPTLNEWHKAAYHKNDGATGNYFEFPTSADNAPANALIDPDPGNNATFNSGVQGIGAPYYRTEAGAHENSDSPYGTFDQGGNINEWTETLVNPGQTDNRAIRGGSFNDAVDLLRASRVVVGTLPDQNNLLIGFRLALLSTPCTADFDSNGVVAVPDIFTFLSAWFASLPSADIDGNGQIQVPDIFAFLALWFAGCQ
jgi:formylglycine-generating enzyme required for sulfatase activity